MKSISKLCLLPSFAFCAGNIHAAVLTLQNGVNSYSGNQTAHVRSDNVTGNFGGDAQMVVGANNLGVYRSVISFDLSPLAAMTPGTIDSVSLAFTTVQAGGNNQGAGTTHTFTVSLLGDGGGTFAFDESTVTYNTVPATAGGTIGTTLSQLDLDPAVTGVHTFGTSASFSSAVSSALAGDGILRMILTGPNEGVDGVQTFFRPLSDDHGTLSNRPLLTVSYSPIPEPSGMALALLSAGAFAFRRRP